jgi:hypothetical protein
MRIKHMSIEMPLKVISIRFTKPAILFGVASELISYCGLSKK